MITGDPPQQKRSQRIEIKKEFNNFTQVDFMDYLSLY
ncbi:hypothetical protein GYH30_016209 [Glycine max]|nr:hypothetical protein GYH30_016209 [Glycine max]